MIMTRIWIGMVHTNHTNDGQVTQIDHFRSEIAQSTLILTIINTNYGFPHDNTIMERASNKRPSMKLPPIISGISDDYIEVHQLYSS